MKEFAIQLSCVQDVQDFVSLATEKPFLVHVRDLYREVNGKSFLEMFCLNFAHPLTAVVECGEEDLRQIRPEMHKYLAE